MLERELRGQHIDVLEWDGSDITAIYLRGGTRVEMPARVDLTEEDVRAVIAASLWSESLAKDRVQAWADRVTQAA